MWPGDLSARARRALAACFVAGIALRLALVVGAAGVPPWSDMALYEQVARAIAAGGSPPAIDRPLAYPLFLSALVRLGLRDRVTWTLVQAVLSMGVAVGAVFVGRTLANAVGLRDRAARIGAWSGGLVALSLTVAQYSTLLLSETLFALCFMGFLAVFLGAFREASTRRRWATAVITGLLAGANAAIRPAALAFALGSALACPRPAKPAGHPTWSSRFFLPALTLATALLTFTVATHWVNSTAGSLTPSIPTSGTNLYLGNSEIARWDGGGAPGLPAELASIVDPRERDRELRDRAIRYALAHPVECLARAVIRAGRLLGVNPGRVEFDALTRDGLPGPVAAGWLALEWWAVVLLTAVGLGARRQLRAPLLSMGIVAAPYIAVLLVTFVQTRYRLPIFLMLVPFAATGADALSSETVGRAARPTVIGLLGIGLATDLLTRLF